jgi:hypothetical protein
MFLYDDDEELNFVQDDLIHVEYYRLKDCIYDQQEQDTK